MLDKKRISRMRWACRRGMLELDVLLGPFMDVAFDSLSDDDQILFERLLTSDDPDLFAWFMGHVKCEDPELARIVDVILKRVKV